MRIIWQTVRRITYEILGAKGLKGRFRYIVVQCSNSLINRSFSLISWKLRLLLYLKIFLQIHIRKHH